MKFRYFKFLLILYIYYKYYNLLLENLILLYFNDILKFGLYLLFVKFFLLKLFIDFDE